MNAMSRPDTAQDLAVQEAMPSPRGGTSIEVPASRWWTARRASMHVGAGPKEIYRAVRAGQLKAVRLNRRGDIRTLREWVDVWMEAKQRSAEQTPTELVKHRDRW